MNLFFESLELSKDTLGVLSTAFFTDRASRSDLIGMTRYELMQNNNPQILEHLDKTHGYKKVYEKVNEMFTGEIYDFVMGVLERVDESMPADRKIFEDESKTQFTDYGYYVTKFMAEDLAKYAFIKALVPNVQVKINSKGQIIYNTEHLRKNSSLQQLGVKAHTYTLEAQILADKMKEGLRQVITDAADLDLMKQATLNRFENTNANSFKYAEALVDVSGYGVTHRIDALKDVEDIESIRNKKHDHDQIWKKNVVSLWRHFKDGVNEYNTHSILWDEITDSADIGGSTVGTPMEIMKGAEHTSEAGYSYFFTDLMKIMSGDAAKSTTDTDNNRAQGIYGGNSIVGSKAESKINEKLYYLLSQDFPLDYIRTLYNFCGNHDKPRLAHIFGVNLEVMNSDFNNVGNKYRDLALRMVTGASDEKHINIDGRDVTVSQFKELPFDALYNLDDKNYINRNYFIGVSAPAVAMAEVLRTRIDKFLLDESPEKNNTAKIKKLHEAVTDLVNGNFTIPRENRASYIDYKTAIEEVLNIAIADGLNISPETKAGLINSIEDEAQNIAVNLQNNRQLKTYQNHYTANDYPNVSHYMLTLANVLKQAANNKIDGNSQSIAHKFNDALITYMSKYPESYIHNERMQHQLYNSHRTDDERNAFGVADFREAIRLTFEKAGLADEKEMQFKLFKAIHEPIKEKLLTLMRWLVSLPGVVTLYAGDEFGLSGYEEKTENLWLQCRNALMWSKLSGSTEEELYYQDMVKEFKAIMALRKQGGNLSPLNDGTPYFLECNKATNGVPVSSILTQDTDGSTVVSLFNVSGISPDHNYMYSNNGSTNPYVPVTNEVSLKQVGLKTRDELLGTAAGLSLTLGMVLKNVVESDKSIYKVVKNGIDTVIKRFEPQANGYLKEIDIVINGGTAQHGVLTLYKKLSKNIHFKGNNHKTFSTPQYHIVSNPNYFSQPVEQCGEKLSILAK